ncbi:MAG: hypothetical protein DRJ33_08835 [Candidatus Methanomethylicota archaeon]|uniref:Uncharacterized protein n=1 Tax=Thermoproteota archaeon TaxID=2056631 RepID=A0A497EPN6_9CREN|nr:MAG: hypothetical protein DRJ33_08835 [Candidatus Verstraetearchaeota archaeon]
MRASGLKLLRLRRVDSRLEFYVKLSRIATPSHKRWKCHVLKGLFYVKRLLQGLRLVKKGVTAE